MNDDMRVAPNLNRRALLTAAGALSLAALAAPAVAAPTSPGSIDVHGHAIPDAYRTALAAHGITEVSGQAVPDWSPTAALAFMNRFGVAAQILSLPDPGVGFVPDLQARIALAKTVNEYLARLVNTPTGPEARRFGAFATLPLRDLSSAEISAARTEAQRAIRTLGLDGVTLYSNYGEAFLNDKRLNPLLTTLSLLGARVQVHPMTVGPNADVHNLPDVVMEAAFNQTRTAVELSYARSFLLFGGIRWLFADAAGTLPYLAYRASLLQYYTPAAQNLGLTALGIADSNVDFRCLNLDTAWAADKATLQSARDVVGPTKILFGSDWPMSRDAYDAAHPPNLSSVLAPSDAPKVERSNALALFPRVRRSVA
jgi:6-methylsalicylate decarboxylase